MLTRRCLLKKSAVSGAAILAFETCLASPIIPPAPEDLGHNFEFLSLQDRGILSKIIPVILADSLPSPIDERELAIKEVIIGWDIAVLGLPILTQTEIKRLFEVMNSNFFLSMTPRLITGVPDAWEDQIEIDNFLNKWRRSDPKNLITGNELRVGYIGLVELTFASWYGNPRSWKFCGYSGPINLNNI